MIPSAVRRRDRRWIAMPWIGYGGGREATLPDARMSTAEPRITLDPAVLDGKPVVRGTRLSVGHVVGLSADGSREQDTLSDSPGLTTDDIMACLARARDLLKAERAYPTAA